MTAGGGAYLSGDGDIFYLFGDFDNDFSDGIEYIFICALLVDKGVPILEGPIA